MSGLFCSYFTRKFWDALAITSIINCAHDGNLRDHVCRFAVCDLFSIGVTARPPLFENYLIQALSLQPQPLVGGTECQKHPARQLTYEHETRFQPWIVLELL